MLNEVGGVKKPCFLLVDPKLFILSEVDMDQPRFHLFLKGAPHVIEPVVDVLGVPHQVLIATLLLTFEGVSQLVKGTSHCVHSRDALIKP